MKLSTGHGIRSAWVAGCTLALACSVLASPSVAATITVTSLADEYGVPPNGNCSIREAFEAANQDATVDQCAAGSGSDEILIPAGRFVPTFRGTLTVAAPASIRGAGRDATVLEGILYDNETPARTHVFTVTTTSGPVNFRDLTVTKGMAGISGVEGSSVSATNVRFERNYFATAASDLDLDDIEAIDNGRGGGLRANRLTGRHVRAISNTSSPFQDCCGNGGGIYAKEVSLVDSEVRDNYTGGPGGGIWAGRLALERTAVTGNSSGYGGGVAAGSVEIRDSTITGNHAGMGAGLAVGGGSIADSTISGNVGEISTQLALGYEYALFPQPPVPTPLTLVHVTVVDTDAASTSMIAPFDSGERLLSYPSDIRFVNSVIVGVGCRDPEGAARFQTSGGNLESPNDTCGLHDVTDLASVADAGLEPLESDGRGGEVHPLLSGSPAVDSAVVANCSATDQTGFARPADGNGDGTATCDRGAFERRPPPCQDLDGDGWGNPASATCPFARLDCNDLEPAVNPGHKEVPGNSRDDDCSPTTSDCKDLDGDGYGRPASKMCPKPQLDCDNQNPRVNPGRKEIPRNGRDDDCNPTTPPWGRP